MSLLRARCSCSSYATDGVAVLVPSGVAGAAGSGVVGAGRTSGSSESGIPAARAARAARAAAFSSSASGIPTDRVNGQLKRLLDVDATDTDAWVANATSDPHVKERLAALLGDDASSTTSDVDQLTSLFRYHNSSMLDQLSEGHMIKATVVKVDGRKAILDLRNGKFATIGMHELNSDSVLERGREREREGDEEDSSSGPRPPRPGDTVRVFLESIETPEGDVLVRGQESAVSRRTKAVWQELLERLKDGRPVKGRLLNSLAGGYSVGVAGIVCFLPNRNASKVTAGRIGELSEYRVIQMNASRSNVVLSDCRLDRGDRGRGGEGRRGGRGGRGGGGGELLRY